MRPFFLLFKDLFKPFSLALSLCTWAKEFRHEVMFFFSTFLFTLLVFLTCSVNIVNFQYYRHIHRGIWEDIMITLPDSRDFSRKDPIVAQLKRIGQDLDDGGSLSPEDPNHSSYQLNTVLKKNVKAIVFAKRTMTSLNVARVIVGEKDMSRIHGQMDIWIKSIISAYGNFTPGIMVPPGSVAVSRSLIEKFNPGILNSIARAKLYLGQWGMPGSEQMFKIQEIIDAGGDVNVIYINPADLTRLGLSRQCNLVGVNLKNTDLKEIKQRLAGLVGSRYLVETGFEKGSNAAMSMLIVVTSIAVVFFAIVLLINSLFATIHNYEKRRQGICLLGIYNYGRKKKMLHFAALNMFPAVCGIFMALVCILLDWPIPFFHGFLKPGFDVDLNFSLMRLMFDPLFVSVVVGMMVFHFCLGCGLVILGNKR